MTEEKARELQESGEVLLAKSIRIVGMSDEDLQKMSHTEKDIMNRYGFDIRNEGEKEMFEKMTKENFLSDIKQIEAMLVLSDMKDQKLFREYSFLTNKYDIWYGKEGLYKPQLNPRDKKSAEDFLFEIAGVDKHTGKEVKVIPITEKKKPEEIFEKEMVA
jgi:hypothetical protein